MWVLNLSYGRSAWKGTFQKGKDYGAEAGPDSGNLLMAEGSYSFKDAAGICASRKLSK